MSVSKWTSLQYVATRPADEFDSVNLLGLGDQVSRSMCVIPSDLMKTGTSCMVCPINNATESLKL